VAQPSYRRFIGFPSLFGLTSAFGDRTPLGANYLGLRASKEMPRRLINFTSVLEGGVFDCKANIIWG
jgi:hypothetical protein